MISIPGYRIIRELGRGGMATVWLAMQESVDREVALKLLSPRLLIDPTFGDRFLREARIAARLHHRHIVAVYDVGVSENNHYAAMEHLSGGPVMGERGQAISPRLALRCIREVAEALDYAHSKGFIHRDVKPDNILLREDGSCVLCDFGIARAATAATQMTKTGSVVGTPYYMSPEQLRGMPLDGRADLYSLGVVFYHLLTGDVPYRASDSLAVGIMHMTAPLPRLPASLAAMQPLLDRMLAKEAADRVQTGAEVMRLVQALERRREWASDEIGEAPTLKVPSATRRVEPVPEPPARPGRPEPSVRAEPRTGMRPALPADGSIRRDPLDDDALADFGPRRPGASPTSGRTEPSLTRLPEDPEGLYLDRRRQQARRRPLWPWITAAVLLAGAGVGVWTWPQWGPPLLAGMQGADLDDPRVRARAHMDAGRWFAADGDDALAAWLTVQATEPRDPEVLAGLERVRRELVEQVQRLAGVDSGMARQIETRLRTAFPDDPAVGALRGLLAASGTAPTPAPAPIPAPAAPAPVRPAPATPGAPDWRAQAANAENAGRWYEGSGSALDLYLTANGAGDRAEAVQIGIEQNLRRLEARFRELAADGRRADARSLLEPYAGRPPIAERVAGWLVELDAADVDRRRTAEIAELLKQAEQAEARRQYTSPAETSAMGRFRAVLALQPDNADAQAGLARIAARLLDDAEQAIAAEKFDMATRLLTQARTLGAARDRLTALDERLRSAQAPPTVQTADPAAVLRMEVALEGFERALAAGELLDPPGDAAYDQLRAAMAIDRNDPRVQTAARNLALALRARAVTAAQSLRYNEAFDLLNDMRNVGGGSGDYTAARNEVAEVLIERARRAIQGRDVVSATQALNALRRIHATHPELPALDRELANIR